jgi:NDP-sugar pyrophosphorylase family protein
MQLIIPMSGVGQRFKEKGFVLPKPLIPISGRPMVQHVVEMFPGVEDVLFIVNKEHFEDLDLNLEARLMKIAPNAEIKVIEPHKLGPAWAIQQSSEFVKLDVPVVVNYCDFACTWDFTAFREKLHSGIDGLIATYSGFHPHMLHNNQYAYLELNESGNLIQIQEKLPFTSLPMDEPASSGTYGFGSGQILLEAIRTQIINNDAYNQEFYSSLTYKNMVNSGKIVKSFEIERFFQWGTPEDFIDFKMKKDFFTFKLTHQKRIAHVDRIEILAAGAGKRFWDLGYREAKPFLKAGENFLAMQAIDALGSPLGSKGILLQENAVVSQKSSQILRDNDIEIHKVKSLTKGQAESALVALMRKSVGSCIIGTCDSLVYPNLALDLPKSKNTLGVWVTNPSKYAKEHPEQFGWVSLEDNGEVKNSWIKKKPSADALVAVITGTFYFGDDQEGADLLKAFLEEGELVNDEFYLDSLLSFAAARGWTVIGFFPEWFISLGTPEEYETYRYWESVFENRKDLLVND